MHEVDRVDTLQKGVPELKIISQEQSLPKGNIVIDLNKVPVDQSEHLKNKFRGEGGHVHMHRMPKVSDRSYKHPVHKSFLKPNCVQSKYSSSKKVRKEDKNQDSSTSEVKQNLSVSKNSSRPSFEGNISNNHNSHISLNNHNSENPRSQQKNSKQRSPSVRHVKRTVSSEHSMSQHQLPFNEDASPQVLPLRKLEVGDLHEHTKSEVRSQSQRPQGHHSQRKGDNYRKAHEE